MQLPAQTLSSRPEAKLFPQVPRFAHDLAFRNRDDAPLPAALLEALRPYGVGLSFRRGQRIFAEGELATHWYCLATGAVRVCTFAKDGRRHVAELVLPGDFFGLEACELRGAAAEAARDAVVTVFPRACAEAVIDADQRLARAFREITCRHLHEAQARLLRLGRTSALERVTSFLLEMAKRCRPNADQSVDLPMTRDDIADYLGLKSETVSRTLTELRHRGAITLPARQRIRLTDRSALDDVRPYVRRHASAPIPGCVG